MKRQPINDALIERSYGLLGLLRTCERAANSLDSVGDGHYREQVTSGIASALDLAIEVASAIHDALENNQERDGVAS